MRQHYLLVQGQGAQNLDQMESVLQAVRSRAGEICSEAPSRGSVEILVLDSSLEGTDKLCEGMDKAETAPPVLDRPRITVDDEMPDINELIK